MSGRWWLIPGTLCTHEVFAPLLDAIGLSSGDCRIVRLDRPAITDYSDEIVEISEDDVVIGFSLGAIVAAHHLDRFRARAAVLLSLNPFADQPEKRSGRLAMLEQVQGGAVRVSVEQGLFSLLGPAARDRADIRQRILAMAEATAADLATQTHLALSRPGAERMIAHARSRVLFLTGEDDRAAPPSRVEQMAARSGHRFVGIAGAGHYLPLEAPLEVARHIENFLGVEG